MLKGYKTYIVAGVAAIGAIANWLVGDASLADTVQLVVTAALGATLRDGIKGLAR